MRWIIAADIKKEINLIIEKLNFFHIDQSKIICLRSFGSSSKARARIWSFPRVWQLALSLPPHYIIEVISQNFDRLKENEKKEVLIHELLHIPKNFSGGLLPHKSRFGRISQKKVKKYFQQLIKCQT